MEEAIFSLLTTARSCHFTGHESKTEKISLVFREKED
jgi:hypothetical protein